MNWLRRLGAVRCIALAGGAFDRVGDGRQGKSHGHRHCAAGHQPVMRRPPKATNAERRHLIVVPPLFPCDASALRSSLCYEVGIPSALQTSNQALGRLVLNQPVEQLTPPIDIVGSCQPQVCEQSSDRLRHRWNIAHPGVTTVIQDALVRGRGHRTHLTFTWISRCHRHRRQWPQCTSLQVQGGARAVPRGSRSRRTHDR